VKNMLTFITGNADKHAEVERILGRPLIRESFSLEEIQAIELEPVIRHKARQAFAVLGRPVLVEDTGLAFAAWNGLPGALIKWFLTSLGAEGICRLLQHEPNRAATATTAFAYYDGAALRIFSGAVQGSFAEMPPEKKDQFSMRRIALERLRDSELLL
jgi:non-canonical purine NTP pyrophosphatase (RdgB/HAM1 family)